MIRYDSKPTFFIFCYLCKTGNNIDEYFYCGISYPDRRSTITALIENLQKMHGHGDKWQESRLRVPIVFRDQWFAISSCTVT